MGGGRGVGWGAAGAARPIIRCTSDTRHPPRPPAQARAVTLAGRTRRVWGVGGGGLAGVSVKPGGGRARPHPPRSPSAQTFHPGGNNPRNKGTGSFYDNAQPGKSPTVWEYKLGSEAAAAGKGKGAGGGGDTVAAADLRAKLTPERVNALLASSATGDDGRVDFNKFIASLRQ